MIVAVEDYFSLGCGRCARFGTPDCSTRRWLPGLMTLRHIALEAGLVETAKWGHPCYMHAGRNVAIIGAFRDDFRLTFFNATLLRDPDGVLEKQGPNTAQPDCIRFTDSGAPATMAKTIRAYLAEAMAFAKAGILPQKSAAEITLPDELVSALDADPDLAEAFAALTPGRKKSWALFIGNARTSATRDARIAKGRTKIAAGKGATER